MLFYYPFSCDFPPPTPLQVLCCLFFLNDDFYFFHYSGFTVFCELSTVQQSDPAHTHTHTHIFFFSHFHTILHHVPSQVTRYSSLCYTAGSHCLSTPNVLLVLFFLSPVVLERGMYVCMYVCILIYVQWLFFHYSWFTVICQFSTVQHGGSVTLTCIHSFFSHYHALS